MKIGAVIQARMCSTRFRGKVLSQVCDQTLLEHLLERLLYCKNIHQIIVATTSNPIDNVIAEVAQKKNIPQFRGSEDDVLDRYYHTAKKFQLDAILRLTADCPLADPQVLDRLIEEFLNSKPHLDYAALGLRYPEGINAEIFSFDALETAWKEAALLSEREHVTSFIWNRKDRFRQAVLEPSEDLSGFRFTVDEEIDLKVVQAIFESLYEKGSIFYMQDVISFLTANPQIANLNLHIQRNEGYAKSIKLDRPISSKK